MPPVVFKRARDVGVLEEKRLREVHEGEVQLALRPSGIGEVGVDN